MRIYRAWRLLAIAAAPGDGPSMTAAECDESTRKARSRYQPWTARPRTSVATLPHHHRRRLRPFRMCAAKLVNAVRAEAEMGGLGAASAVRTRPARTHASLQALMRIRTRWRRSWFGAAARTFSASRSHIDIVGEGVRAGTGLAKARTNSVGAAVINWRLGFLARPRRPGDVGACARRVRRVVLDVGESATGGFARHRAWSGSEARACWTGACTITVRRETGRRFRKAAWKCARQPE